MADPTREAALAKARKIRRKLLWLRNVKEKESMIADALQDARDEAEMKWSTPVYLLFAQQISLAEEHEDNGEGWCIACGSAVPCAVNELDKLCRRRAEEG